MDCPGYQNNMLLYDDSGSTTEQRKVGEENSRKDSTFRVMKLSRLIILRKEIEQSQKEEREHGGTKYLQ